MSLTILLSTQPIRRAILICFPRHCEGPAPTETADANDSEDADDSEEAEVSEDPGPSPTESKGCEPHGDHWHCGAEETEPAEPVEGAAGSLEISLGAVVAVAAFALA